MFSYIIIVIEDCIEALLAETKYIKLFAEVSSITFLFLVLKLKFYFNFISFLFILVSILTIK